MKKMIKKIKHYFWWKFIATDEEKLRYDLYMYGVSVKRSGKRIDPKNFYLE